MEVSFDSPQESQCLSKTNETPFSWGSTVKCFRFSNSETGWCNAINKLVLILQVNYLNVKFISHSFPCLLCYSYSVMRRQQHTTTQVVCRQVSPSVSLCNKPSCRQWQVCLCVVRSIHQHLLMLLHSFCHLFNQCSDFLQKKYKYHKQKHERLDYNTKKH